MARRVPAEPQPAELIDRLMRVWKVGEFTRVPHRHLPNLLTYLRPGHTNAGLEAVNAVIQGEEDGPGVRNPEHSKIAIYFHCGGLDLYPNESR